MVFRDYVQSFQDLYLKARPGAKEAKLAPLDTVLNKRLKKILIIAPHPDDECLMSGLALRAKEEWGTEVYVLPFSYGSNLDRHVERKRELGHAVNTLGFTLYDPRAPLFHEVGHDLILDAIRTLHFDALIIPHARDCHPAHLRTHLETMKALETWKQAHTEPLEIFETEYWLGMDHPNLLVPLSKEQVSLMGMGLEAHRGEIERNPYHLSLPSYLVEQKRRGSEIVGGMGSTPNDSIFGQIYRSTYYA